MSSGNGETSITFDDPLQCPHEMSIPPEEKLPLKTTLRRGSLVNACDEQLLFPLMAASARRLATMPWTLQGKQI
jgi:hypothetical protein